MTPHIPVLLHEVLQNLQLTEIDIVLDGTLGFGGHSFEILKKIPQGILIGIDQDPQAIRFCQDRFGRTLNPPLPSLPQPTVYFEHIRFDQFESVLEKNHISKLSKVLLDLGMSSYQLDSSDRGFSFQKQEPLDMRMNPNSSMTAATILNAYSPDELTKVFRLYGEIYKPDRFIEQILQFRAVKPFMNNPDLVFCIKKGFYFRNKRSLFMRTCAQVFQALRIEVNSELTALKSFLEHILPWMADDGRIAIISFHSLEDRMIKEFGKKHDDILKPVQKKVIHPSQNEIRRNSRARSAKLRVYRVVRDLP